MTDDIDLRFAQAPSVLKTYPRALTNTFRRTADGAWPLSVRAVQDRVRIDPDQLTRYCRLCGFVEDNVLPIVFPHVLAFPLQMTVMTDRRFPVNLLGLIHVRNRIVSYQPITTDTDLSVMVSIDDHRELDNGREFDLATRFFARDGDLVWFETSTMRARRARPESSGSRQSGDTKATLAGARRTTWSIPADLGRRYARVAGDYNPIHLGRLPARLFGFPKPIATGMWLQAAAAAELVADMDLDALAMSIEFRKPVFMPAEPVFLYALKDDGGAFMLVDQARNNVHLTGTIGSLSAMTNTHQTKVSHADT